jgi:hypothetical protein
MSVSPPTGLAALVEIGMADVDLMARSITPKARARIQDSLTRFVEGCAIFIDCHQVLFSTIHRDDPIIRVRELVSIFNEPLPDCRDREAEISPLLKRQRKRSWSTIEDNRLIAGIARFDFGDWPQVATLVGNSRTRAECAQRWRRALNPRISIKSWSPEENQRLCDLVEEYGQGNWAKIASILGNRSDVQCRYHYQQKVFPARRTLLPTHRVLHIATERPRSETGLMSAVARRGASPGGSGSAFIPSKQ